MNNTKSSDQTNLQTATNLNDYQIKIDEQPHPSKNNQVNDNLSFNSKDSGLDKANCHLTPLDSENGFSLNNQDTKSTSFGIKQFWYIVQE